MPNLAFRAVAAASLALAALFAAPTSRALTPADLPPVDQVFQVSATSSAPDRIDVSWTIAKGYYLYRHQFKFTGDANFKDVRATIPAGKPHHDEFFGDVETYRDRVTIPVSGIPNGDSTVLTVKYQGCADAGICYPPTTKKIKVNLTTGSSGGGLLQRAVGGLTNAVAPSSGLIKANDNALPAERAFSVDAQVKGGVLQVTLAPVSGYYLYQRQIRVSANDANVKLGAPKWPKPKMHDDLEFGMVPVYFDPVQLNMPLHSGLSADKPVRFTVAFQGCKDQGVCYPPMSRQFELTVAKGTPVVSLPPDTPVSSDGPQPAAIAGSSMVVAPDADLTADGSDVAAPFAGTAEIAPAGSAASESPSAPNRSTIPWYLAIGMALLGGLILNLMPCVLPVLSLKAISIANHGASPAAARTHALAYTAGVLLSFVVLGGLLLLLRGLGDAVGWAFQMQQPLVVGFLALLIFALGLSLSGVWHAGGKWLGMGNSLTQDGSWRGDFFTGLLAVVVATPCIAPFMGAALAWAFFAPAPLAMGVFIALGLGLALPFLLLGFVPGIARLLPKPGAWMETFKQIMAVPMYLTAIWLAWVVGQQRGAMGMAWLLVAALLIVLAVSAWSRANRTGKASNKIAAVLLLLGSAGLLWHVHKLPVESASTVEVGHEVAFDKNQIATLNAQGKTVFVNITADWCISCKVNERAVLKTETFKQQLQQANAVYMVGDYTNVSDALTAYLQEFKAVGVPLYVVYKPDGSTQVLPTILTKAITAQALQ